MSIHPSPSTAPAVVLGAARNVVAELDDPLWVAVADGDLVEGVVALLALEAHLGAVKAELVAEIDSREIPRKVLHWASTGDWFAHLAGVTRGAGRRVVVQAHDLVGDRTATLEALRDGAVSPEQAGIVVHAVSELPGDPVLRAEAETVLLDEATRLDATDLARDGRHIADVVDPDRARRRAEAALDRGERAAHLQRGLSISEDGAGGVRVRGRGSVEDAAILRAALLPLSAPAPAPAVDPETGGPGERDPRDHGARTWDALIGLAQHALNTDAVPESHGARPRVSVLIDLEAVREEHRETFRDTGFVDTRDTDDNRDTADTATAAATTDDGLELSAATVRRLACDADIIPIALGTTGMVLDVGRAYRTCPHHLWLALVARDRHCAFPGCTRPPVMTDAHHIVHWADGGPTALHNLALLCGHHHRVIHHTPWQIRLNADDGHPEFLPPPRHHTTDPPTWIRHRPRHRPPDG